MILTDLIRLIIYLKGVYCLVKLIFHLIIFFNFSAFFILYIFSYVLFLKLFPSFYWWTRLKFQNTLSSTFKFVFERSFALKFLLDCPSCILIQESITVGRRIKIVFTTWSSYKRNDRYVSIVFIHSVYH